MSTNFVDVLVIGGGVIGLAIAKSLPPKVVKSLYWKKKILLVLLPVPETAE